MDWDAVAKGLAASAETIEGVTGHPNFPPSVTVPAFIVTAIEGTVEGYCAEQLQVTCALLVGMVEDREAATGLYQYAAADGDQSVMKALESDPTLGGVCNDVTVTRRRIPRVFPLGTKEYLAAELIVLVDGGLDVDN